MQRKGRLCAPWNELFKPVPSVFVDSTAKEKTAHLELGVDACQMCSSAIRRGRTHPAPGSSCIGNCLLLQVHLVLGKRYCSDSVDQHPKKLSLVNALGTYI